MYSSTLTNIEISTLVTQIHENKFDLDAPYQRDIVWDAAKQSLFINSILKGIIPSPLIFVLNNNGLRTVIDGKQRITSILRFMRDEIPVELDDEIIYNNNIPLDINITNNTRVMDDREKTRFSNINLNCVTYQNISYEDQLLIFNRIQKGVQISSADLLKASAKNKNSSNTLNEFYSSLVNILGKYTCNTTKEKNNHIILITNIMYMIKFDSLKTYTKSDRILAIHNYEDVINETDILIRKIFPTINKSNKKLCNYMLYPYIYCVYKYDLHLDVDDYYDTVKEYKGKKDYKSILNNILFPN